MVSGQLPEYDRPPVAEVVLGFSFHELTGFSAAHFGLLWDRLRNSYPRAEDHPALEFQQEIPAGSNKMRAPQQSVRFVREPKLRSWFLSADGTQLLQVQSNAFMHNWRKQNTDAPYPRYAKVRESFVRGSGAFDDFVRAFGLGAIRPTQCELTYVNHIRVPSHTAMGEVLNLWRTADNPSGFLPELEDGQLAVRYPIQDPVLGFLGRLSVSVAPAYVIATGEEILNMTLVARGRPMDDSIDGVLRFFDLGHQWIVNGFTELTTSQMHASWGRRR